MKRTWHLRVIAGIKGTSLIDYPGKVAAVLYMSRCNFRCPFCHNRELVLEEDIKPVLEEEALAILASRRGFIDGAVITGGEPTIHSSLSGLIRAIRKLGFTVKLDTNGYNLGALKRLLAAGMIDFVAMDIKTSLPKYSQAVGVEIDTGRITESIELIKDSSIECEFRTTCVPSLVDSDDIEQISKMVGESGWLTLQQFQPENTLDPNYNEITPYPKEKLIDFLEIARQNVASCRLIGMG
jgi:pyruvate formate lyase activating enzyme